MKPTLLVFGEDWGRHPSSSQHLVAQMAKTFRIIWVNSIGLRSPSMDDMGRLISKGVALSRGAPKKAIRAGQPDRVIAPKVWPMAQSEFVRRINRTMLASQLKDCGPIDYIWCALPSAVDYLPMFPDAKVIYYCGDDFESLAGVDHQLVADQEQRLASRADYLFCASRALVEKHKHHGAQYLPHGVDYRRFAQHRERAQDLPDGPIVGFYGSLSQWIDYSLLESMVDLLPEIQLVLIGENHCCPDSLLNKDNVHWLGPKPHHQLAQYSQYFDVALLPFVRNGQIAACNPLKLREYLAAGVPVVSVDCPEVEEFAVGVAVATSDEEYIAKVLMCLLNPKDKPAIRTQVVGQSWQARAEALVSQLQPEKNQLCNLQNKAS